jgi:hypothetical protein
MFKMLQLACDIIELRQLGLTDEEISGYIDFYIEDYDVEFYASEFVN